MCVFCVCSVCVVCVLCVVYVSVSVLCACCVSKPGKPIYTNCKNNMHIKKANTTKYQQKRLLTDGVKKRETSLCGNQFCPEPLFSAISESCRSPARGGRKKRWCNERWRENTHSLIELMFHDLGQDLCLLLKFLCSLLFSSRPPSIFCTADHVIPALFGLLSHIVLCPTPLSRRRT